MEWYVCHNCELLRSQEFEYLRSYPESFCTIHGPKIGYLPNGFISYVSLGISSHTLVSHVSPHVLNQYVCCGCSVVLSSQKTLEGWHLNTSLLLFRMFSTHDLHIMSTEIINDHWTWLASSYSLSHGIPATSHGTGGAEVTPPLYRRNLSLQEIMWFAQDHTEFKW